MTDTEQIFERLDVNYVWPDSTRFPKKAWITGIHFVFIFIWKSRYDLRPCNSRLRSHLSQLGSLGDSRVHLMQSDRSPPTPRPLGANPRNARPHNITLPITKNGTRFNGLSLSLSLSCSRIFCCKHCRIYLLSLLPTADVQTQSEFNVSIAVVQIWLTL